MRRGTAYLNALALTVHGFLGPSAALSDASPVVQFAVDTIAFMLWGLEEGAKTKRISVGVWEIEDDKGDRFNVRIARVTDCLFRITSDVQRIRAPHTLEFSYVLNFALVDDYGAWFANDVDRRIIVQGLAHESGFKD